MISYKRRAEWLRAGLLLLVLILGTQAVPAQTVSWDMVAAGDIVRKDSLTRKGFTLVFINLSKGFNDSTRRRMIETFFEVYPRETARFNPDARKKVTFVIDPAYQGVAAAHAGIVRVSPAWMEKNPEDIDVVTHEVMHIVQEYPGRAGPGWLTEGIADYVRAVYGVNNDAAGWEMPELRPEHHYTSSYRITARFLCWLEKHEDSQIVDKLDRAMRSGTYHEEIWRELTGKPLNRLWKRYTRKPAF